MFEEETSIKDGQGLFPTYKDILYQTLCHIRRTSIKGISKEKWKKESELAKLVCKV